MNMHKLYKSIYDSVVYTLPYKIVYFKALRRKHFRFQTLLTYPQTPIRAQIIYKIAHVLGYSITNNLRANADVVMHFEDATYKQADPSLLYLKDKYEIINYRCVDISKVNVDTIFQRIFGYSMSINPLIYEGTALKKSNLNGLRDMTTVTCPINTPEKDYVYQKIISNRLDQWEVEIRVPVYKQNIPFVYLRYRDAEDRFNRAKVRSTIGAVQDVFSPEEVDKLHQFCQGIGMDFGELDIIRERDDGRIYILDANDTPAGPLRSLSVEDKELVLTTLCYTFEQTFCC